MKVNVRIQNILDSFFQQNILSQIPMVPFDFEVKGQGYEWILVHSVCVNTFVSGQYTFKKLFTFCNILCCLFQKRKVSILRLAV